MIQNFNLSKKNQSVSPYLSFIGTQSFSLQTKTLSITWNGTLEYSTDKTTWTIWDGTEIFSVNNSLFIRGRNNTRITYAQASQDKSFVITTSGTVGCFGNIETLLDYESVSLGQHPTMDASCFANMFLNRSVLTHAPDLPSITLSAQCYYGMFSGCTSLVDAPALPATTLQQYCYDEMFKGCTSLVNAPALPATTLSNDCYGDMFSGCTSLVNAPTLPASTTAIRCYYAMFKDCTSLVNAPALPATKLTASCYQFMFSGCTNLESIPALPATSLKQSCYEQIFLSCSKIKISTTQDETYLNEYRIPTSGTGTNAQYATTDMFRQTGGTFTSTPSINITYYTSNAVVPSA